MAAVMAAGMVPLLSVWVSLHFSLLTTSSSILNVKLVKRLLFWVCASSLPVQSHLQRVTQCVNSINLAGGALAGALSMLFGCGLMAPHGGLFVLIPGAINVL